MPLALVGGAALYVAKPPDRDAQGFAAPEAQRVVEDWLGNSAGFGQAAE